MPEAIIDGQLKVALVNIGRKGDKGNKGDSGDAGSGGERYEHTQPTPSATWTINHNLGVRLNVSLFTTGGVEFDGQVQHTSDNQTVVTLNSPTAGYAILS